MLEGGSPQRETLRRVSVNLDPSFRSRSRFSARRGERDREEGLEGAGPLGAAGGDKDLFGEGVRGFNGIEASAGPLAAVGGDGVRFREVVRDFAGLFERTFLAHRELARESGKFGIVSVI
jgi:hypothetical protein